MELWLDTADITFIKNTQSLNLFYGITTNPSILASVKKPPMEVVKELLEIQLGYVAVQVTETSAEGMIKQGRLLHHLHPQRIIIKIPVIENGLRAMAQLRKENINVLATTVYTANQVLLACLAGAQYIAPYLGGIEQASGNYIDELELMLEIIKRQQVASKLMAAAIRDTKQITLCAALGVQAATLPAGIVTNLLATNSLTQDSLNKFAQDWQTVQDNSAVFA